MIKRKKLNAILKVLVIVVLILPMFNKVPEISAIASQANLKQGVTVTLYNKQLMPADEGQVALVTLLINNTSSSEVDLIDYWARIKGKSNSYVTKISSLDEHKKTVLPGNKEYISYYAQVSNDEKLTDISVEIIKWDFSKSSYESILGNLTIAEVGLPQLNEAVTIAIGEMKLTAALENQFVFEEVDHNVVSYRVKISNELNRVADLSTLTSYVVINTNDVYEAKSVLSEGTIASKDTVYLYGQVNIPKDVQIDAMNIALVEKQGENMYPLLVFPAYTLSEGQISTIDKENSISLGSNEYTVKADNIKLNAESNRVVVNIPFTITNKSKATGNLSTFSFYIKTKAGLVYKLNGLESNPKELFPEIEETFEVTGFVPNEQALKDAYLLVGVKVNETEVIVKNMLLGEMDLSQPIDTSTLVINGQEITFERLTRTPNSNNDLVVAEFVIKNISKDSKKPVKIGGEFEIDGVKVDKELTKFVRLNTNLSLLPNESERVIAYFNVPFTQQVSEYVFNLTVDDKKSKAIVMNISQGSRLLAENEKYTLKTVGKRGEVTYLNSEIYSGTKDDLFVVNLKLKNTEKRNIVPANLSGYIQTKTQEIYQLNFEKLEKSIMPNGEIILTGTTPIPKVFSTTDLTIHFGEQLSEEEVIYIDPVFVMYKPFNFVYPHLINQVSINDKKFWVWDTRKTWLTPNSSTVIEGINVEIDYQLDNAHDAIETVVQKDLMVEYQDLTHTSIRMQHMIPLSGDANAENRNSIVFNFKSNIVQYELLTNYDINVYQVLQGYKKLVVSQNFAH